MSEIYVAKSYMELPKVGDVFISAGKKYINVQLKSGKTKTVRVYSEAEYKKLYPEVSAVPASTDPYYKPQKEVLGFTKGYITIFKGDTYANLDWFRLSIARYARWWGWYIISTEEVPEDLPMGLKPVRLYWEAVGQEDGSLKPEHLIREGVDALLYEASNSEHIGKVGERLELYLTVDRLIDLDNNFGHSSMHIMKDDSGNSFIWTTASKSWAADSRHHIRGTVKQHTTYKNEKQTVLTRCMEVK